MTPQPGSEEALLERIRKAASTYGSWLDAIDKGCADFDHPIFAQQTEQIRGALTDLPDACLGACPTLRRWAEATGGGRPRPRSSAG